MSDGFPAMPSLSNQAAELVGWKEIARYLRVSVRTAQGLEKNAGLPIRRGAGLKAPVFAIPSELDAWRRGRENPSDSQANSVPSAAAATRRRDWLRYSLGGAGAIAAGALLGYGLPRLRFSRHNPHDFRVEGSSLIIFGSDGTELWRHTFPQQLDKSVYLNCEPECDACQFSDVDGDGRLETLFRLHAHNGGTRLLCFDPQGKLLWDFAPTRTVVDNLGGNFAPPFWPNRFGVFGSKRQNNEHIIVSSNHNWSFPDQVAVLNGKTGELVSEYWHRGHLLHMASADLDGDGEPEILLGGVNDAPEYKRATVVIFDHRNISGASKNPKGGVYFHGMNPGTEKKVIFFPRTPISKNLEFNRVSVLKSESGRIRVNVVENTGEDGPYVVYEFNYQLRPINVALSNTLMERYRELQASGHLPKESFDNITERLKSSLLIL